MRASLVISLISVVMSLLAASFGIHGHARAHRRALTTKVEIVTEIAFVTVTVEEGVSATISTSALSTAINATSIVSTPTDSTPAPTSVLPNLQHPTPSPQTDPSQSSIYPVAEPTTFHNLIPVPSSALLKNSCAYPVYIWSTGHASCASLSTAGMHLTPNGTYISALRKCADGGVSLRVSKTENADKVMQFEYAVWDDEVTVSYDISYLNCMEGKDLGECAGHDGGIQAVGGGDCQRFSCKPGEYCDRQAYVVAEFGYLPGAPVGGCEVSKGIAFELCAGERE
jgi:hypothetical protein